MGAHDAHHEMAATPDPQGFGLWEVLIALGMLGVNFIGAIVGGTWVLARSRAKVVEKIDAARLELEQKINVETDHVTHDFGETVSAIRQKMNDMELWNRDNFVNKSTFNSVMDQWRSWFVRFEDKMDKRLDRIDAKLDERD